MGLERKGWLGWCSNKSVVKLLSDCVIAVNYVCVFCAFGGKLVTQNDYIKASAKAPCQIYDNWRGIKINSRFAVIEYN